MTPSYTYYFNNAATTWPKPASVVEAVKEYFTTPPINSSRHCNCLKQEDDVDNVCKRKIAEFLNVNRDKYDITLTAGCTYSANIVINWFSKEDPKPILITDNCAHNSIYRTHFEKIGTKPFITKDWNQIDQFEVQPYTNYYVAISHVNNVDGTLITDDKIFKVIDFCEKNKQIPFILDITQSAGSYEIDLSKYNYDNMYVICSCHKGLYSTTGIGFLISPKGEIKIPLISGGTGGANGIDYTKTGSLEAGTPNELAMASAIAGIDYINQKTIKIISIRKKSLVEFFLSRYNSIDNNFKNVFELVECKNPESGILCFKMLNRERCEEFITHLTKDYNIIVRSGVHCAPLYHINVLKVESTMRISFGTFNTIKDIEYLLDSINKSWYAVDPHDRSKLEITSCG